MSKVLYKNIAPGACWGTTLAWGETKHCIYLETMSDSDIFHMEWMQDKALIDVLCDLSIEISLKLAQLHGYMCSCTCMQWQ